MVDLGDHGSGGGAGRLRLQQNGGCKNIELHYKLFKSEHKSYDDAQDLAILDECGTVANVGWLRSIMGLSLSKKSRPPTVHKRSLGEIDGGVSEGPYLMKTTCNSLMTDVCV